jgi:hypothetical protein
VIPAVGQDVFWPGAFRRELKLTKVSFDNAELISRIRLSPELERLDLSNTAITDSGLRVLESMTTLQWLILDDTQVGDEGLKQINGLPKLRRLSLAGTNVSDRGLDTLVEVPDLENIDLRRTKVSAAGVARLKKRFPNAVVNWSMN